MALKLIKSFKGKDAEYWKIILAISNYVTGSTRVLLGLYWDRDARDAEIKGWLERKGFTFNQIDMTREEMYMAIKEPIMQSPGIDTETGKPLEEVDTNEFTEALDINPD